MKFEKKTKFNIIKIRKVYYNRRPFKKLQIKGNERTDSGKNLYEEQDLKTH